MPPAIINRDFPAGAFGFVRVVRVDPRKPPQTLTQPRSSGCSHHRVNPCECEGAVLGNNPNVAAPEALFSMVSAVPVRRPLTLANSGFGGVRKWPATLASIARL